MRIEQIKFEYTIGKKLRSVCDSPSFSFASSTSRSLSLSLSLSVDFIPSIYLHINSLQLRKMQKIFIFHFLFDSCSSHRFIFFQRHFLLSTAANWIGNWKKFPSRHIFFFSPLFLFRLEFNCSRKKVHKFTRCYLTYLNLVCFFRSIFVVIVGSVE